MRRLFDIVYCEWLKLKYSKIVMIGFFGSWICPILTLSSYYIRHYIMYSERVGSLFEIYDSAITFLMLLFGPIIMALVAVFLITREYAERTWKTIFVVPVSRIQVMIGKFLILFFLMLAFLFLSWFEIFVLSVLCSFLFEISGVTIMGALFFLIRMIQGGIFLYPTIIPFIYLALRTKGGLIPFIVIAGISLVNVVLSNTPISGFWPWLLPYSLLSVSIGRIKLEKEALVLGIFIVLAMCVIGIGGSIWRIWREDIE